MTETQHKVSLIDRLEREHRDIRCAVMAVVSANPECKKSAVRKLVRSIVQHELGEEVVVYPAARRLAITGDLILDARLAEQAGLDRAVDQLAREDVDSPTFTAILRDLAQKLEVHTRYEEQTVLEPLRGLLSEDRLAQLGWAYARIVTAAPPYPYPSSIPRDNPAGRRSVSPRVALLTLLRRIGDRDKEGSNGHVDVQNHA